MSIAEKVVQREMEACTQGIMSDVTHLRGMMQEMEIEPDDISAIRVIKRLVDQMASDAERLYQSQKIEARNGY